MHSEIESSNSQMIDTNHDGLDDRLVDKNAPKAQNVKDIMNRVHHIPIPNLNEDVLLLMQKDVQDKMDQVLQLALQREKTLHQNLLKGKYSSFASSKKNIRHLYSQYKELEQKKSNLEDHLQEKRLQQNLENKLSKKGTLLCKYFSLVLSILILSLLVYDIYVEQPMEHILNVWNIFYIDIVCCLFFQLEFFFRFSCAEDKRWFLRKFWIDFLSAIPFPPAETFRFFQLGRTIRFLRLLRMLSLLHLLRKEMAHWHGLEYFQDMLDFKMMERTFKWSLFVILFGAITIMKFEGHSIEAEDHVGSFSSSIWWSFTTVVTGGFADLHNPLSTGGQILTCILVISGMVFVGVFTATLTSLYVGEDTEELEQSNSELKEQLLAMQENIEKLHQNQRKLEELLENQKRTDKDE